MIDDLECDRCGEVIGTISTKPGDRYGEVVCLDCLAEDEDGLEGACADDESYI